MLIVSGQYTVQQVVSCSEWTFEVFKENYLPYDHDWNSLFTNIYINEFLGATYIWNFCLKIYVHINIASVLAHSWHGKCMLYVEDITR